MKSINRKFAPPHQAASIFRTPNFSNHSTNPLEIEILDFEFTNRTNISRKNSRRQRFHHYSKSDTYVVVTPKRDLNDISTKSVEKNAVIDLNYTYSSSKKPTNVIHNLKRIAKSNKTRNVNKLKLVALSEEGYSLIKKIIFYFSIVNFDFDPTNILEYIKGDFPKLSEIEFDYIDTVILYVVHGETYNDPVKYITVDVLLSKINNHLASLENERKPLKFPRISQNELRDRLDDLYAIACIRYSSIGIRSKEFIDFKAIPQSFDGAVAPTDFSAV